MPQFHLPTLEAEILAQWEKNHIVDQILSRNSDTKRPHFVFFEGPPGANGKPGTHHVLSRVTKDLILRFRTMQGYRIDRKSGWDTHGLPVELAVEKKLGFTKKQDIEQFGIAAFNDECRASVWEYLEEWNKLTKRVGVWLDLDHPYVTYDNSFIESGWWIFSEVANRDLLYKGFRITPHCPRCVTSLSSHELAQGYKDTEDPSVFVKFQVKGADNTYFLVWTTTPWTLPANVALAVGADIEYVRVKITTTGETFVLAKELLSALKDEYEIVKEAKGSELAGTAYEPLFNTLTPTDKGAANAHKVYVADFVSTKDGTGIVHIAPAFGEDDYALGLKENLPTLFSVDAGGMITMDVAGKGKFFKTADPLLTEDLQSRNLIYRNEKHTHSYPFCWRCSTPILYFAKSSWYVKMSSLRDKLIENNAKVNWYPTHVKDGRFGEWIRDVKDWAISRERYWGTPLPIWECSNSVCKATKVVASFADLERLAPAKNTYHLIRHGEAEHNIKGALCPIAEANSCTLTDSGKEQVLAASTEIATKNIDVIYSSDSARTRDTASIIAKAIGFTQKIQLDTRLRETEFGALDGVPVTQLNAFYATPEERFTRAPEGGETLNDVRKRVMAFIRDLEQEHQGKNILIVSHGDTLWMFETLIKQWTEQQSIESSSIKNAELREMPQRANLPVNDLGQLDAHRPYIDSILITCEKCQNLMHRIPDVADVWFDSGAMPFAQWHYPFENKHRIDELQNFPADFIAEGVDQTRGWFYTLLAVTTALGYDFAPYKNVICHGLVLDKAGKKMSKSKGNVVDPWDVANTLGIDALRFFFYSANQPYDDKLYDPKALEEITKKNFLILWNVVAFYKMYANGTSVPSSAPDVSHALDKWILTLLSELRDTTTNALENYDVVTASRSVAQFINDLSTWYVRRSRDRFKEENATEPIATLGFVLHTLAHLMAPMTPFVADAMYRILKNSEESDTDSVHLESWPEPIKKDEKLLLEMEHVRLASSLGLEQRAKSGIAIRQALSKAVINAPATFSDWMCEILAEELNVHKVTWQQKNTGMDIELETTLTPALLREGAAREFVRHINDLRKNNKLTPADCVIVCFNTESEFWKQTLDEHGDAILKDVRGEAFETSHNADETDQILNNEHGSIAYGIRKL